MLPRPRPLQRLVQALAEASLGLEVENRQTVPSGAEDRPFRLLLRVMCDPRSGSLALDALCLKVSAKIISDQHEATSSTNFEVSANKSHHARIGFSRICGFLCGFLWLSAELSDPQQSAARHLHGHERLRNKK